MVFRAFFAMMPQVNSKSKVADWYSLVESITILLNFVERFALVYLMTAGKAKPGMTHAG